MKNQWKIFAGVVLAFLFLQSVMLLLLVVAQIIWPAKPGFAATHFPWNYLLFSLFNIGVLVITTLFFIDIGRQEHERWKLEKEEKIREANVLNEKLQYDRTRQDRLDKENYENAVGFFKYMLKSGDCQDPKIGFPENEEFEKINQIISAHMNITSNNKNKN